MLLQIPSFREGLAAQITSVGLLVCMDKLVSSDAELQ
jgi:hypothetical protein